MRARHWRRSPGPAMRSGTSLLRGVRERPDRVLVTGVERRQVFDLPPVKVEVTEHQLIERQCGCGHKTKGTAPAGVDAPVQYGSRITAIVLYLYGGQFLSKSRTAMALASCSASAVVGHGRRDGPAGR